MPDSVCNIRVRRESPHWEGRVLHVGHEWIEMLDDDGNIIWSAGFWPTDSLVLSRGQVLSPDPYSGRTANTIEIERTASGRGTAFGCDEKDCDDIRTCVQENARNDEADPPNYALIGFNCRNWVTMTLTKCCILKSGLWPFS